MTGAGQSRVTSMPASTARGADTERFHFARGNLRKLLAIPRYALGSARSTWTTRDPALWVVGSAFGVGDGALAFCRAAAALPNPPRLVWLAGSPAEEAAARAAGIDEVAERDSPRGLDLTLRAGLLAVTHGFGDVNRYGIRGAVIVQLWHGAPLKKLHADSPAATQLGMLGRIPGMTSLMRWLYRRGTRQISLLPTGSEHFVPSLCSAFDLTPDEVRVLGEPRTDVLFRGSREDRIAASRSLLASHLGALDDRRVVLYAPTWRDGDPDPGVPSADQWSRIDAFCERFDCLLVIRPHPLGIGDYTYTSPHVRVLPPSAQPESMPLLWGLAGLVTDYSSMLVDFAVTDEPIVFLAPDLAAYEHSRGLYDDYGWLSGGVWHGDWDGVVTRLEQLFSDQDALARAREHSASLARTFHTFTDGRSAERVCASAADLVAKRFRQ